MCKSVFVIQVVAYNMMFEVVMMKEGEQVRTRCVLLVTVFSSFFHELELS